MTLEERAYRVMRRLESGDIPRDHTWDIREIMDSIADARDDLMMQYVESQRNKEGFNIPTELVSWFKNIEVKEDTDLKKKYITLPGGFASLPFDQGIYHVSDMDDPEDNYKLSTGGPQGLFSNMVSKFTKFWYESHENEGRLYFSNLSQYTDKIYLGMVVRSGDVPEDAPLPMLSWMGGRVEDIVFQRYGGQVPQDNINNTTDVGKAV